MTNESGLRATVQSVVACRPPGIPTLLLSAGAPRLGSRRKMAERECTFDGSRVKKMAVPRRFLRNRLISTILKSPLAPERVSTVDGLREKLREFFRQEVRAELRAVAALNLQ